MQAQSYIPFTKEMKKEYTILMPTMLPRHFELRTENELTDRSFRNVQ